ncbi:hypothetical protein AKJ09_09561 [Labilithrix luteola]|uniref:Peptidase metallopeptidase domain-containing protein n=1 Tax=Labilithrix luteola TaxID=1391654 RepID=A0A0K1QAY7_9BACT|nr:matrixin family metalloprotease [Labilithrix luteola]AKV02898.1 hypothetical protein AKJ09_09561 [Labilithrix luteola]
MVPAPLFLAPIDDTVTVVAVEVSQGSGPLADEPITIATLRARDGAEHIARIVGGPNAHGGFTRLAGYVVPVVGMRVRADLLDTTPAWKPAGVLPTPRTSFALNTPAGTWPDTALPVTFVLAGSTSRDVGDEALAELDVATRTWSNVDCTGFRAGVGAKSTAPAGDDGINGVYFQNQEWPAGLVAGAIGQTVVHVDASGRYRDADIHINSKNFRFSLDGQDGTIDLRSVLVHELGHALGLGHSTDPRATMFATVQGLRSRSLEKDDIVGVCTLYPGEGEPGCDSSPCPSPLLCVAGRCQRRGDATDVCSPCERVPGACDAAGDDARCIDIGEGATAGRVCGRACENDTDCGMGFHCRDTTTSGDRQCVSEVRCANGANVCTTDTDCRLGTCRAGACVGPTTEDAGNVDPAATPTEAGVAADASDTPVHEAGCTCSMPSGGSHAAPLGLVTLTFATLARAWKRRSRR